MASYRFKSLADYDLLKIANYTLENWGIKQSRIYRDKLNITVIQNI